MYIFGSLTIKCPKDLGIKKKKYEKYPEIQNFKNSFLKVIINFTDNTWKFALEFLNYCQNKALCNEV